MLVCHQRKGVVMIAGSHGTYVIPMAQTQTDGVAAPDRIAPGAVWRWWGEAVRLDGATGALLLQDPQGDDVLRKGAARMVRRLTGRAAAVPKARDQPAPTDTCFAVTDGRRIWFAAVLYAPSGGQRLLLFSGDVPPAQRDLWVVRAATERAAPAPAPGGICLTPDTCIATPDGLRPLLALRPDDRIVTRDNGVQRVLWRGVRRYCGAQLHAQPRLRPLRIRAQGDLLLAPGHRLLLRDPAAQALFNCDEVLARAGDLLDGARVRLDHALRDVTYAHILLGQHDIIWINGVEVESLHPDDLPDTDPDQAAGLRAAMPDGSRYREPARRSLSPPEAAILRHREAA